MSTYCLQGSAVQHVRTAGHAMTRWTSAGVLRSSTVTPVNTVSSLFVCTFVFWTNKTSLSAASYVSYQRDAARICCRAPCCGAAAAGHPVAASSDLSCPYGAMQQTANPPRSAAAIEWLDWQETDGQTLDRFIDTVLLSEYCASSVINWSIDWLIDWSTNFRPPGSPGSCLRNVLLCSLNWSLN